MLVSWELWQTHLAYCLGLPNWVSLSGVPSSKQGGDICATGTPVSILILVLNCALIVFRQINTWIKHLTLVDCWSRLHSSEISDYFFSSNIWEAASSSVLIANWKLFGNRIFLEASLIFQLVLHRGISKPKLIEL